MRVGIDGYNLAMPRGTGIATYAVELAAALRGLGHGVEGVFGVEVPADERLRESVFFDALDRERPAAPRRRMNRYRRALQLARAFRPPRPRIVPMTGEVEKRGFRDRLPAFDRLVTAGSLFDHAFTTFRHTGRLVPLTVPDPPDVMHWTYPVPVILRGSRNVYTFHDLVPLKLPYTTLDDKLLYGRLLEACVRGAAQICTVSRSSSRDICERFALDVGFVTNTYQAAPPTPAAQHRDPAADARDMESIFGLRHRGYFLYYGAIEPKKNVGRLIEAYLSLRTATPLVIVGARAWQAEGELSLMPAGGADGSAGVFTGHCGQTVVRLDYLARDLLAKLVRGATALVFPSLYEGFGLPVLEAMQIGTPVITSTISSLPEIAGDAALLVDPYDVAQLREAMARIDGNEALGRSMAARGLKQATLFSRERYQERLTELYAAAMARR